MNDILKIFFSLSVLGSITALILFALIPIIKHRFSRRWQYYVWLIVILRLLLPVSLFPGFNKTIMVALQSKSVEATSKSTFLVDLSAFQRLLPESPSDTAATPAQSNSMNYLNDILGNIWLLWLGTAVMLMVRKITDYHNFMRYIKAGINELADYNALAIYEAACQSTGLKKPLRIYSNGLATSPMLVGIFHPFIVLPDIELGEKELYDIFTHELTHYKRLDIFYKWLTQFSVCLHWYNPLVYLISREINRNCELSCDEAIIRKLDDNGRISYGDTLLASLKPTGSYSSTIVSISLNEDAKSLKERLEAIMAFKRKPGIVSFSTLMITLFIIFSAAVPGVYAADNNSIVNVLPDFSEPVAVVNNSADNSYDALADQTYMDKKLTFFSTTIPRLSNAKKIELLSRAYDDDLLSYFSVVFNNCYLSSPEVDALIEKSYVDKKLTFFSVILNEVSPVKKSDLLNRAYKDNELTFYTVLLNNSPDNAEISMEDDNSAELSTQLSTISVDTVDNILRATDKAAIELMNYSGSWDIAELLIPLMSHRGIDLLTDIYNQKNQHSGKTLKNSSDYYNMPDAVADSLALEMTRRNGTWVYIEPFFPYMTNDGIDKVIDLYNQKHSYNTPKIPAEYYEYEGSP